MDLKGRDSVITNIAQQISTPKENIVFIRYFIEEIQGIDLIKMDRRMSNAESRRPETLL